MLPLLPLRTCRRSELCWGAQAGTVAARCLTPAWLQRARESRVVGFLKDAAGPVISYAAA